MTIKRRIMRLTPIAAAAMISMALLMLAGSAISSRFEGDSAAARAAAADAAALERRLLRVRQAEKSFLLQRDRGLLDTHAERAERAGQALQALAGRRAELAGAGGALDDMRAAWQAYSDAFAREAEATLAIGLDRKSGLRAEMRAAAHAAEAAIERLGSPSLHLRYLQMRRHEKDFLARLDPGDAQALAGFLDEIRALPPTAFRPGDKPAVVGLLERYADRFDALAETLLRQRALRAEADAAFAGLAPPLSALDSAARARAEAADATAARIGASVLALEVLLAAAAIAAIALISRRIARATADPLEAAAMALEDVAEGREGAEVPGREREDEIGRIARAFDALAARLDREAEAREAERRRQAEAEREQTEAEARARQERQAALEADVARVGAALQTLAAGDLPVRLGPELDGDFATLRDAFNDSTARLAGLIRRIRENSDSTASVTARLARDAQGLSDRASSQASSLEETAASVEEISATIKTTADNAGAARRAVENAAGRAERGGAVVREAVEAMGRIEDSSHRISEINTVIDAIAFQTNLLALNAAVEAARAGEAGKGFAVVAAEVRTLAQRSSEAAKDITGLIQQSGGHVAEGARLVRESGEALEEIEGAIAGVAGNVGDISTAMHEQAAAVAEISQAVAQMDGMTQQNADLAEQSAAASNQLATETEGLLDLVGVFGTGREAEGDRTAA